MAVLLVFGAAGLAVVAGAVEAVLGWGSPREPVVETSGVDEECVDPPCLPESWPPPESLPLVVPVLVLAAAVIIGVLVLVWRLPEVLTGAGGLLTSGLLLVAAPVLVLVGAEIVPHVVTPCWAGELGGVCVETEEHGVDYADHLHQLGHAVLGWLPMTVGYWLVLRKWHAALLPWSAQI